ncbi:MAG: hypothetical protein WC422_00105 [Candidatus Paceibacterota bacterium]|jgi:hypothetical protein
MDINLILAPEVDITRQAINELAEDIKRVVVDWIKLNEAEVMVTIFRAEYVSHRCESIQIRIDHDSRRCVIVNKKQLAEAIIKTVLVVLEDHQLKLSVCAWLKSIGDSAFVSSANIS